jgi:hypothetical protein
MASIDQDAGLDRVDQIFDDHGWVSRDLAIRIDL